MKNCGEGYFFFCWEFAWYVYRTYHINPLLIGLMTINKGLWMKRLGSSSSHFKLLHSGSSLAHHKRVPSTRSIWTSNIWELLLGLSDWTWLEILSGKKKWQYFIKPWKPYWNSRNLCILMHSKVTSRDLEWHHNSCHLEWHKCNIYSTFTPERSLMSLLHPKALLLVSIKVKMVPHHLASFARAFW